MSSIRWRLLRLEHTAQDGDRVSESEAIRYLSAVMRAAGNGTPIGEILLPDLSGTKAGAFLEALREMGQGLV